MSSKQLRSGILAAITSPLGFYTLALLIVEAAMGTVLAVAGLTEERRWAVVLCMIGVFVLVLLIVAGFAALAPKNLVFGKEEHSLIRRLRP